MIHLPISCMSVLAAGVLTLSFSQTRIYWIGNSVTDALKYSTWEQTAEADAKVITWGRMMIPGAPISWLWEHPSDGITEPPFGPYSTALTNYTWDFISLQPYDRALDEYPDGDVQMSLAFMNYAKGKSPNAQFVLFGHYPRTSYIDASGGYQQHWVKPYRNTSGGNETREFYNLVIQKVRQQQPSSMKPMILVPVGEVYFELDKKMRAGQISGKSDIVSAAYADGIHQNDFGNYIVGCTYYSVMFKQNPTGFSGSRYGVSGTAQSVIQQTVWSVVSSNQYTGVGTGTLRPTPLTRTPTRSGTSTNMPVTLQGRRTGVESLAGQLSASVSGLSTGTACR